jgi:HlyD family secretion protein
MLKLIRSHPILTCLFLGACIAGVFAFRPRAILVSEAEVRRAPMSVYVSSEGETRVKDLFIVSAPLGGSMERINLDVGDRVTKATPLTRIAASAARDLDPRAQQRAEADLKAAHAALNAAHADAEAAEAEADLARTDLKRLLQVKEQQAVAASVVDSARSKVQRASAGARSARLRAQVEAHRVESAQALAHYIHSSPDPSTGFPVTPPVDGVVLRIMRDHAGPVQEGEPLVALGNPENLEVMVDVLSEDAVKISPGTRVFFERWGGTATLEGVVTRVEPIGFTEVSSLGVDEQRVYIICAFTSSPADWKRLGSGYRVIARFLIWHTDAALQVPSTALFRRDESQTASSAWWVYTIEEGRARLRRVDIGEQNDLYTQIKSGLDEGERVVNHPGENLSPDSRVKIR